MIKNIFSRRLAKLNEAKIYIEQRSGDPCPILKGGAECQARFCLRLKKHGVVAIDGRDVVKRAPRSKLVSVLAVMPVFNDDDILGQTVEYYISQSVDVHIIDNRSTDRTKDVIAGLVNKYPRQVSSEVFPLKNPPQEHTYQLKRIISRVDEVAANAKHDWIISCDADEIRTAPDPKLTLQQYITAIDGLGYNAIDFTVLDFKPTADGFDGTQKLDDFFQYFEFGKRAGHFVQVRGWKNQHKILNFSDSAGHAISFEGIKIYPLKFLLKHYPIRSTEQARKKLYQDRVPDPAELSQGMHTHYGLLKNQAGFIKDKKGLLKFDNSFYEKYEIERLTGAGIVK